jgi:hypothetical protein
MHLIEVGFVTFSNDSIFVQFNSKNFFFMQFILEIIQRNVRFSYLFLDVFFFQKLSNDFVASVYRQ